MSAKQKETTAAEREKNIGTAQTKVIICSIIESFKNELDDKSHPHIGSFESVPIRMKYT